MVVLIIRVLIKVLGELGAPAKFNIATKVYPVQLGDHEPEKLKATFKKSLEALKVDSVDLFYLHAPVTRPPRITCE